MRSSSGSLSTRISLRISAAHIRFSAACVCKSNLIAMAESCGLLALFNRFISTELQMIILTEDSRGAIQNITCWEMASSVCSTLQELCCMPLRRSLCRLLRLFAKDAISCIMLLIVWSFVSFTTYSVSSLFSSAPRRLQISHFFDRLDTTSVLAISSSMSILLQVSPNVTEPRQLHNLSRLYVLFDATLLCCKHVTSQEQHKRRKILQKPPRYLADFKSWVDWIVEE